MFSNLLIVLIDCVIALVEWSVACIRRIKEYGVRVWQNNAIRKWVFHVMDYAESRFHRYVDYLEDIETRLQCRIVYAKITKPMKQNYRALSGRRTP